MSLVVGLAASAASAATYYLDPQDGAATCSPTGHTGCNSTACRSFSALTQKVTLAPGDDVRFCSGTFRETVTVPTNGASGNPITLERASLQDVPVISGLDLCSSWSSAGSGVYKCAFSPMDTGLPNQIQKLFVDGTPIAKSQATGCPSPVTNLANAGYCANYPRTTCSGDSDCSSVGGSCVKAGWCYDGTNIYLKKSDGSSPTSNSVEVGSRAHNLVMDSRSNLTIDGLTFFGGESVTASGDNRDYAIRGFSANNVTFRNNTMNYSGGGFIFTFGGAGALTVTNNTFANASQGWSYPPSGLVNGYFAFRIQGGGYAPTITINGNTFQNIGTHNWARSLSNNCGTTSNTDACYIGGPVIQGAAGLISITDNVLTNVENGLMIKFDHGGTVSAGSEIARNTITDWPHPSSKGSFMVGAAMRLACETSASGSNSGAVEDCTSYTGAAPPIIHQLNVHSNRINGGRVGIVVSVNNKGSSDAYAVRIYNNFIKGGDRQYGWNSNAALSVYRGSQYVQVYNNTIECDSASPDGGSGLSVGGQDSSNSGANAAGDFRNNIFRFASCAAKVSDLSSTDTWTAASNLCDAANSGKCVTGASSLSFINEAGGDFHLAGSGNGAAIDQGITLSGFNDDIDGVGRPVGLAWDIGANEFGGSAPVPPVLISVQPLP